MVRFFEIRWLYFSTFLFAEFCNTCVYKICFSSLNSCYSLSTLWFTIISVFVECDCSRIDQFTSDSASICASIFCEFSLNETSRISRSMRI